MPEQTAEKTDQTPQPVHRTEPRDLCIQYLRSRRHISPAGAAQIFDAFSEWQRVILLRLALS